MSSSKHVIKVAADASGKIVAHAKGNPATIVAYGTAAALVFVGIGIGYGAYIGGKALSRRLLGSK